MEVVYEGLFHKEGSWVRSWKRRYFEIVKDGHIVYKEDKTAPVINGIFDISGRLDCTRYSDTKLFPEGEGLSISSTSTGRLLNVIFDNHKEYQDFCIGIAKVAKYHNLYKLSMEEGWSELFLEGSYNDENGFVPDENEDYNNSDDSSGDEAPNDRETVGERPSEALSFVPDSNFKAASSNNKFTSQLENSTSSMDSVIVRDCRLNMSEIDHLLQFYYESKKKTLDIAGCHLAAAGISKIMLSLTRNAQFLMMLNLNDNSAKQLGSANIGSFLVANKTLVELNLFGNFIGDGGVAHIAKGLISNNTLERLFLGGNAIGQEGCTRLSESLKGNRTLRVLDLSENAIGLGGSIALSSLLMENKSIRTLNVSYQTKKIGPEGAILFSKVLRQSTSGLSSLMMARNRIGFEGCRHIAGALLVNKTLTELDISGANFITMEGSMQLAQAMSFNTTLIWLGVGDHRLNVLELRGIMPSANSLSGEASHHASLQVPTPSTKHNKKKNRGSQSREVVLVAAQKKIRDEAMMQGPRLVCFVPPKVPVIASSYNINNCCDWTNLLDELSAPRNLTETIAGEQQELIIHYWGIYINPHQKKYNFGSLDTTLKPTMVCTDDAAVVMATLLRPNTKHFCLNVTNGFLPLQHLLGSDICQPAEAIALDLSFRCIKSADAIIIGGLLSENVLSERVNLKGNSFAGTEGENWIVYGLTRNVNLGLDDAWPPQHMYVDGYKALAATKGTSASGMAIEPQRLDTYGWQFVAICGCAMFYTGIVADILTIIIYNNNPEYYRSWVVFGSVFLVLPTFLIVMITASTIGPKDPMAALKTCLLEMSQIPRFLEVRKSVKKGMETAALLDHQFMYTVFKAVPQVVLQLYITFIVAIEDGTYSLVVMGASAISLCIISSMMVLLYDRKQIRLMSMAQASSNPWCTRMLASALTLFGVGGSDNSEGVQELVDYDSFYASNYVWCTISYLTIIPARAISITWLLAVAGREIYVVFITVLGIRMLALYFLDSTQNVANRPWFRFCLQALSLTISDSAWKKDDLNPIESFNCFIILSILTTLENVFSVAWAAFLTQEKGIKSDQSSGLYFFGFCVMILRWVLIVSWVIPVHYPELMSYNDIPEEEPLLEDELNRDRSRTFSFGFNKRGSGERPASLRLGSMFGADAASGAEPAGDGDNGSPVTRNNRSTSIAANGEISYGSKLRRASLVSVPQMRRASTVKNIGWTPPNRKSFYDMRRQQQKSNRNLGGDGEDGKSSPMFSLSRSNSRSSSPQPVTSTPNTPDRKPKPMKSVGFAIEEEKPAEEVSEGTTLKPKKRATGNAGRSSMFSFLTRDITSVEEETEEDDVEMGMTSGVTESANAPARRRGSVFDYILAPAAPPPGSPAHSQPFKQRQRKMSIFGEAPPVVEAVVDVGDLCKQANRNRRRTSVSALTAGKKGRPIMTKSKSLMHNPSYDAPVAVVEEDEPSGRLLFLGPFEKKGPTSYSPWQLRLLIITSYSVDYYYSSYMDGYSTADANKSAFATKMGAYGGKNEFVAAARILNQIKVDVQESNKIRKNHIQEPCSGLAEVEMMLKLKGYKKKGSIALTKVVNAAAITESRDVHYIDIAVEKRVFRFRTDDAELKSQADEALSVISRINDHNLDEY